METENLIIYLYAIPFSLCLWTFQKTFEYYHKLPEQIPVHFDIKGRADKWCKKNLFYANLMPAVSLLTLIMMAIVLVFIHKESGPLPDDFALAFWFFTFALVYLLHKFQIAMISYSLKEINNIWTITGTSMFLFILSCVLLMLPAFISKNPVIAKAVMCAKVEAKQPVDIREHFYTNDDYASLFLEVQNIKGKHTIRSHWYNPEGKEHFIYERVTHKKVLAKYYYWWAYIYIKNNIENISTGTWYIDIYIDKKKVLTKSFIISQE